MSQQRRASSAMIDRTGMRESVMTVDITSHRGRKTALLIRFVGFAFFGVLTISRPAAGQTDPSRPLTFTKDIAPILQRSCQHCHRPGAIAPMSLITYQEVRPWAAAIKRKTSLREMPPWFIDKNIGIQRFKADPSL